MQALHNSSMKQLNSPREAVAWLRGLGVQHLTCDSREAGSGVAFIAWPGAASDGRRFALSALLAGAPACLVESQGVAEYDFAQAGDKLACFEGLKLATAEIAAEFYAHPSEAVDVVAITGTNGKTSTSWWLAQAFAHLPAPYQKQAGIVGTLGVGLPQALQVTGLTTPDPVRLQSSLRSLADAGVQLCAVEASSIGIAERRLDACKVRTAVFTNFTQDHLDYHGSMVAYWAEKKKLFGWPGLQVAVLNVDDAKGRELVEELQERNQEDHKQDSAQQALQIWTYSVGTDVDVNKDVDSRVELPTRLDTQHLLASNLRYGVGGLTFEVQEHDAAHGSVVLTMQSNLIGAYNVANILAVLAVLRSSGVPLALAVTACASLPAVPGRMEAVKNKLNVEQSAAPLVLVDYAHTPDALEKAITALRPLAQARGGKLFCVFGCGGNRDKTKRPLMARAAQALADVVVMTSDNPRFENPETILDEMAAGLVTLKQEQSGHGKQSQTQVSRIVLRQEAIAFAINEANVQDVILIAGKGHEDYQEIEGVKLGFDDRLVAQQALVNKAQGGSSMSHAAMMTLDQAANWIDGATLCGDGSTPIARVHTDTRSLQTGDLFVALKGERYDANAFLSDAQAAGASAILAQASLEGLDLPGLQVADSKLALGQLAKGWRAQFTLPLIAVTGSNGKTTVTQMIASILRTAVEDKAHATRGNLNNDIGVPLTLLKLDAEHQLSVVELGMNHPGEIAYLADMARPTVALVNNAQREHLEFMHTVEAVAQENGSVLSYLSAEGVAVFPADDVFTPLWRNMATADGLPRRCLTFGFAPSADVRGTAQWQAGAWRVHAHTPQGEVQFSLRIAGRHNVQNALAALACALAAGVDLATCAWGLEAFEPVKGRSCALPLAGGRTLVDDTYNANPDSMQAAIAVLAELPAPRVLVMGDMGEVGEQGAHFHHEAGRLAREAGIEHVLLLGDLALHGAESSGGVHFQDIDSLLVTLANTASTAKSILVKGSRFMKMERAVDFLLAQDKEAARLMESGR